MPGISRGLPRRINMLVARLLVHGAIEQRESLAAVDARELARELEREQASTVAFPENGTPADDSAPHGREPSRPVAVGQERTPKSRSSSYDASSRVCTRT